MWVVSGCLCLKLWFWDSGAKQSHGTELRASCPCLVSWVERPNPCLFILKLWGVLCPAVPGTRVCTVIPMDKAVSSKASVLGHGPVVLMGGGKALLGGSWHWAFGGCALARILGRKPLRLSFASMRWLDYLTAYCLPPGTVTWRLDDNRGKQPQTEISEIPNKDQPSLRLSWWSPAFSIVT